MTRPLYFSYLIMWQANQKHVEKISQCFFENVYYTSQNTFTSHKIIDRRDAVESTDFSTKTTLNSFRFRAAPDGLFL